MDCKSCVELTSHLECISLDGKRCEVYPEELVSLGCEANMFEENKCEESSKPE